MFVLLVESFDDFDESSLLFNLALLRASGKSAFSCHKVWHTNCSTCPVRSYTVPI
jgi:hypothetical protein